MRPNDSDNPHAKYAQEMRELLILIQQRHQQARRSTSSSRPVGQAHRPESQASLSSLDWRNIPTRYHNFPRPEILIGAIRRYRARGT